MFFNLSSEIKLTNLKIWILVAKAYNSVILAGNLSENIPKYGIITFSIPTLSRLCLKGF